MTGSALRARRWRKANPERARAHSRTYKSKHKEEVHTSDRKYQLKEKYGITPEQYDAMLAAQGGHCAICPATEPGGPRGRYFAVDHNHATNEVRGLLCNRCNRAIGLLKDDPAVLSAALTYLEEK